ncbi:MAG: hypothetical protein E7510_09955 [Ruminococcus sp.]|nr:hypothetical protein [Ruminococcus sp.]
MIHKKSGSAMLINMRQNFKQSKKWFVLACVLQLLGLPVFVIMSYVITFAENSYNEEELVILQGISVIFFCLAMLVSVFIEINVFSYLHQKNKTDMIMSLPITTKQRFWSDFLSGLLMYVLPYLFSLIPTGIILGILNSKYDLYRIIGMDLKTIIFSFIALLLIMIMLYAFILLALVCCGNLRGAITYIIALNAIIPLFFLIIGLCVSELNYLVDSFYAVINYMDITSPAGGFAYLGALLYDDSVGGIFYDTYVMISWGVKYVIFIVIVIFVAYWLYKKRKNEDTGKFLIYDFIYHILAIMIIVSLFGLGIAIDNILFGFISSSVVYLIFNIFAIGKIKRRKRFQKKLTYYFAVVICTFPFMWILNMFSNSERSLPDSSNMVIYNIDSYDIYRDSYYSNFTSKDKGIYDKVVDICDKTYNNEDNTPRDNIGIAVVDKIGNVSNSYYLLPEPVVKECMQDIWTSKEYREMVMRDFEEEFYDVLEVHKRVDGERVFIPSISIYGKSPYLVYELDLESEEELTELIKCYQDDIRNISEETIQKLMRKEGEYYILRYYYVEYVINEDFKNTMNFINQRDLLVD